MLTAHRVWRLVLAAVEVVALVGNFRYVLGFSSFATGNFFSPHATRRDVRGFPQPIARFDTH